MGGRPGRRISGTAFERPCVRKPQHRDQGIRTGGRCVDDAGGVRPPESTGLSPRGRPRPYVPARPEVETDRRELFTAVALAVHGSGLDVQELPCPKPGSLHSRWHGDRRGSCRPGRRRRRVDHRGGATGPQPAGGTTTRPSADSRARILVALHCARPIPRGTR